MVFNREVGNVLKVWGAGNGGAGGGGERWLAENKGMEKNIERGGCDHQQNGGMYLFELHDSKEF